MKKNFWIMAFCLATNLGFAESFGPVEVNVPVSHNPWVLLFDQYEVDEDLQESTNVKIYTHRQGDALEGLFVMVNKDDWEYNDVDEDNDKEELTQESLEAEINEWFQEFFPNHRYHIITLTDHQKDPLLEWQFDDGTIDIFHGITKVIENDNCQYVIGYFTTAEKAEENTAFWNQAIQNTKLVD